MFKRIGNIIKGIFLRLIGKAERANPEALLEVEKENLRKQITEFNKALAAHAALVEDLKSRAKKLDDREDELRAKTTANLKAGNRAAAGQLALKLKEVGKSHDEVAKQFEESEQRYKELIRARDVSVKEAKSKIENLSRGINDMKVQKATAELNEMAAGMVTEIGGAGDTLNRLEEMVEEERTKAAGRARVASDSMDMGEVELQESEQSALAEMALANFAASEGIELAGDEEGVSEGGEEEENAQGTMGPSVSE
ncbi:MAG: PspA/IM30 family protein [Roseibacillus sp.]|nr:PspA/IM30 family protein [Roseibacillus sp.]